MFGGESSEDRMLERKRVRERKDTEEEDSLRLLQRVCG